MASPTVDIGTGIVVLFGTSGFAPEILDLTLPGYSREPIDTTHQGTTVARTFSPTDLYDGGEFSFDHHYNPDTDPPMSGATETITITFPSTATCAFSGFMIGYEPTTPLEDKMVCTATVKITGEITVTGA